MAKSGLKHIDVGPELAKAEWESEESHELVHGNSFPDSPVERQLFYRDDLHTWYIYDGSAWVDLQGAGGGGVTDHGDLTGLGDDDHPQYIKHSLATAVSNFLVASGAGVFVKKTLAEVKSILNWAADIATHAGLAVGVHGFLIPIVSQEAKTYYIDPVSGNDGNGGEASGDAFETWGKAESMVPMFLLHNHIIRIIGDMAEDVDIRGRIISGSAYLMIRGDTDTPGDHEVNKITLKAMLGDFRVQYLRATELISLGACSSTHIESMFHLEPRAPAATYLWAINATGGFVYIRECDFGTDVVKDCIYIDGAHLVSRNNTGNGQQYGLHARGGGTIGKKDSQPTGTIANEYTTDGGVIR